MRIQIKDLCFSYGKAEILKHIDFQADEGQLIAVLGPNGAGKSTLFRCVLGFLKNYTGKILLDDADISALSKTQLAKKIAYIPQSSVPVFNYAVKDIVLMGTTGSLKLLESPKEAQIKMVREALESLGISYLYNRGFGRISGGERQLVLIARALVQNAKIIIMDEPTANLDYGNQYRVMVKIKELTQQGYTILMATHNPEHALLFADQSFVLQHGEVVTAGDSKSVMDEALMEKLYGVKVKILSTDMDGTTAKVLLPRALV